MVRTASSTTKSIQSSVAARQRVRRKVTAIISALAAGGSAAQYVTPHILKTPMYNSRRTGVQWVQELLAGHDQRFYNMMGLNKHVYRRLLHDLATHTGLHDSKHVPATVQLAIFLRFCRSGASHRKIREQFQHGPDTISKYTPAICIIY
jgi:hypothetical protein